MSDCFVLVRKGDTFQGIALENSITVSSLKKMNHIYGNSALFVGQKLKIKEDPASSLLEEASRSNILKSKGGSEKASRMPSLKPLPPPSEHTHTNSVLDFITTSFWGTGVSKFSFKSKSQPRHNGTQNSLSSDNSGSLSAGFRPRTGSGVGMEDTSNGEVIVTMPLTKSGDFKKAQPQADEVVAELSSDAKKRNEHIKSVVLKSQSPSPRQKDRTFLSTEGQRLVDTEFDAEVVEVDENYFSPKKAAAAVAGRRSTKLGNRSPRVKSLLRVEMSGNGGILLQSHAQALSAYLPAVLQANAWTLLYSVLNNGADLFSFYKLTKGANTTMIVVETVDGDVFGGFASEQWHVDTVCYGGGESFVFKIVDRKGVKVFKWTMENDFILWSNETQIAMGGGGDGFAFALDSDFYTGQTSRSATFHNDQLVSHSHKDSSFQIKNVEVWKLDSCI